MKAYLVTLMSVDSLVWAETRGLAKQAAYRSAREVGYQVAYFEVRLLRLPTLDEMMGDKQPEKCYALEVSY